MSKHPFRAAIEAGASKDELGKLFAPDVVIKAPMLTKLVKGASDVLNIIGRSNSIYVGSPRFQTNYSALERQSRGLRA